MKARSVASTGTTSGSHSPWPSARVAYQVTAAAAASAATAVAHGAASAPTTLTPSAGSSVAAAPCHGTAGAIARLASRPSRTLAWNSAPGIVPSP